MNKDRSSALGFYPDVPPISYFAGAPLGRGFMGNVRSLPRSRSPEQSLRDALRDAFSTLGDPRAIAGAHFMPVFMVVPRRASTMGALPDLNVWRTAIERLPTISPS